MAQHIYESVEGAEAITSLQDNLCYDIYSKSKPENVPEYPTPRRDESKPVCSWLCMCALVGFILVGSAAFASLALTVWNISQVSHQNPSSGFNDRIAIIVNDSISEFERKVQSVMNGSIFKLERRISQLQYSMDDHIELQTNISRSLDSRISIIHQYLSDQYSDSPATSCSHVLLLNSSSPSDHYWIRSSNDSAVRVYCEFNRQCGCNGPSTWTRVAFLDMSDPNHVCPSNWTTIATPVRACGRGQSSREGCDSVSYSTFGLTYSRVCGRITAFQDGIPDAFRPLFSEVKIDGAYLDGVSLTHGEKEFRQHIWSFAGAPGETGNVDSRRVCACSNNNSWPLSTSFVGNDYFCDSGSRVVDIKRIFYPGDPLWDGQGCGPSSTCCQFNNPPWFCKTLNQSTTDDLEVRICKSGSDEDTPIQLLEIYIQ